MDENNWRFTIRSAVNNDYEDIVRCLEEVRGGTYYDKRIYSAEHLRESREITFFVATVDGYGIGAVVGASKGFFEDSSDVLCMLAVKSRFTGCGIATALVQTDEEYLLGKNIPSMKAHVVTGTSGVQSIVEKLGFMPTGILLGVRDNSKGQLDGSIRSDKRALAIYAKKHAKRDAGNIFIHKSISGIAEEVYKSLGASVMLSGSCGETAPASVVESFYDEHHSVVYVRVLECGNDLENKIEEIVRKYDCSPLLTATLYLNVGSPSSIRGFELLRKMGFIFCGFDPLNGRHEYAVMYYGRAARIYYDDIKSTEKLGALLNGVFNIE